MNIDFVKLKRTYDLYADEYEEASLRALRSGWYILGKELEKFEAEYAQHLGVRHVIGVNSGTDALILAARALGIGPGDEVLVPANTYIASVMGITENGATPVFIEPDDFYCIDSSEIERHITEKTKAILPVHLYGQICDMEKICAIADQYHLYVIEDCAQGHGATQKGRQAGTFGTVGCFSFYPTKPLGALGDAGALAVNDDELAQRIRMIRNYGSRKKYVNEIEGVNSRMDELQAAILQVSLRHYEDGNLYRQKIAEKYLANIKNDKIKLPLIRENSNHVWHVFALHCEERDDLQQYLNDNGIHTLIHYPIPPHLQQSLEYLGHQKGDYPKSEKSAACELSLPIYNGMPAEETDYIIDVLNKY